MAETASETWSMDVLAPDSESLSLKLREDFGEGAHPGRRDVAMKILTGGILAAAILAAVATTIYHKEKVVPEVQDFLKQRTAGMENLWANMDLNKYQSYFADFFLWKRNKKYVIEVARNTDGSWIMGKKKYNIKFTGMYLSSYLVALLQEEVQRKIYSYLRLYHYSNIRSVC